jgi:hypothetical protein
MVVLKLVDCTMLVLVITYFSILGWVSPKSPFSIYREGIFLCVRIIFFLYKALFLPLKLK